MRNKRSIAILLSVVMVLSVYMPMSGMSANAADSTEVLSGETSEDDEKSVSPESAEEAVEQEEAANAEEEVEQEEAANADVQEETDTAEELDEDEIPAEQEVSVRTEDDQAAASNNETAEEIARPADVEEEVVETATEGSAFREEENTAVQEEDAEIAENTEPEQLEEDREAVSDSSTGENAAQAIWTEGNTTLTFYYGPLVSVGGSFNGNEVTSVWSGKDVSDSGSWDPVWNDDMTDYVAKNATAVVFDTSFLSVKPTSTFSWLYGFNKLKSVDTEGLDTSNVKDMTDMFNGCSSLTSLDVSGFDTSGVTTMEGMFNECSSLTSLDVSGFDTSEVTMMGMMFNGCSSLTSLDLSGFDTSKVTEMYNMFSGCSLTSLDLRGLTTSKVTDMAQMFRDCSNLTSLDVSSFDTSRVEDMGGMFQNCSSLKSLDLSGFNTSRVSSYSDMFSECRSLKTIYCGDSSTKWKKSGYGFNKGVFYNCTSLIGIDGTYEVSYDSSKVDVSMAKAASQGGYFTPLASAHLLLGKTTRGDMFNLANNVKVTWKEVPGAKYYKVYREGITEPAETQAEPVIVTTGLIGWDKQPGLTNGHAYRYKTVASLTGKGDSSGDSPRSYSKVMYRLKTVVIRSVKNTASGKITVKYDKTTGGDSYVLRYCEREDMVGAKTKVILGADNTSYTIGGLKKGKTYYISIRVRKKVDGINYYTTFGVSKKIKVTQ